MEIVAVQEVIKAEKFAAERALTGARAEIERPDAR